MKISPTHSPSPRYPALATLAVAAALVTPACQQQLAGEAPKEIRPLTVSYVDENGKIIRSEETTQGAWEKVPQQAMGGSMPVKECPRPEPRRLPGKVVPRR